MEFKSQVHKNICLGCLSSNDDNNFEEYFIKNESIRSMFQTNSFFLCYICKRMAQRAESFIQNAQSNQILLANFHNQVESLDTLKFQIQPLVNFYKVTLSPIELLDNGDVLDETYITYSNEALKIKCEMKEEYNHALDHLEGEFVVDDDEFRNTYIKEEDDYPLKALQKQDISLDEILGLTKHVKRKKVSKIVNKNVMQEKDSDFSCLRVEKIYITRQQCFEERNKMAQSKKYKNSLHKCNDCILGFKFRGSFQKHMESHSKASGDYECDICKQRRETQEKLNQHRSKHEVRYRCMECGLLRNNRMTISDHVREHHASGHAHYRCPDCPKVFDRRSALRSHRWRVHVPRARVECAHCRKSYVTKDVLRNHMLLKHTKEVSNVEITKKYSCQQCGKLFRTAAQLKSHGIKHVHRKDYYCVECDKSFKTDGILKHHLKTTASHVQYTELPLTCEHCDKRFAIRRDLERHTNRVHLNVRPFPCDKCDKAYVNSWSLSEHKRYTHDGHKRPLKYPCSMCDKVFNRNAILKSHIRTHTGERPYQCGACPAQFSQSSSLGTHVRLIHLRLTRDGTRRPLH